MFMELLVLLLLALLGLSIGSVVALLKRRYKAALQCAILAVIALLSLCWLANSWGNTMRRIWEAGEEHRQSTTRSETQPETQPTDR